MTLESLLWLPFASGLPLALTLPWLGHYQRLRDEWLAALGIAHCAAMGAMLAAFFALPPFGGAWVLALAAAVVKQLSSLQGNSVFAVMILAAWSASLLLAANAPLGEALAHALVDGQLYFATARELVVAALIGLIIALALPPLAPRLVAARFFPLREAANRLPSWRWHAAFDILCATAIAGAIATFGVMATFALLFLPPWAAFARARSGFAAIVLAAAIGLVGYLIAFVGAYALDQPFGPLFVQTVLAFSLALRIFPVHSAGAPVSSPHGR